MSAMSPEDIKKHVRTYITVFVALLVLTGVTVGVSYVHLGSSGNIIVALVIATLKASLVAGFFMHLIDEKRLIYGFLILTALFWIGLMMLPTTHSLDTVSLN